MCLSNVALLGSTWGIGRHVGTVISLRYFKKEKNHDGTPLYSYSLQLSLSQVYLAKYSKDILPERLHAPQTRASFLVFCL